MLRSSLFVALLGLSGCGEAASPNLEDKPTKTAVEPAVQTPAAPPPSEPPPSRELETEAETEAETVPPEPTPTKREVIRRRCKPAHTPCHGGRECCNDLFEVCGKDNHCHPLE